MCEKPARALEYEGKPVIAIREIDPVNYHPAVRDILHIQLRNCVQIWTRCFSGWGWLNVCVSDLKLAKRRK